MSRISNKFIRDTVTRMLEEAEEHPPRRPFVQTVELQIGLKGYTKKDKRFEGAMALPYPPRRSMRICVLADARHVDEAASLPVDVKTIDDLKALNKDKKKVKKLVKGYHAFLGSSSVVRTLNRVVGPWFNRLDKFPTPVRPTDDLAEAVNRLNHEIKFKLKKGFAFNLPIGHQEMEVNQISRNIGVAVNFLVTLLKKGWQNVNSVHIKLTQGKPHRLF